MSTSDQDLKVRPSPVWYLLVVVLWVGAAVVAFIAFKPFVDLLTADIASTKNNSQVAVPSDGLTVYSQTVPSGRACALTGSGAPVDLDSFDADFEFDGPSQPNYHALASTPAGLEAGTYTLSCSGVRPNADLGVGERVDVEALGKRAVLGVVVPLGMGFVGLVVLIVMLVKRHNSKSRIRNAKAQAASGYYGGYPPGGYPQGGGYPPPPPDQYPPPPQS